MQNKIYCPKIFCIFKAFILVLRKHQVDWNSTFQLCESKITAIKLFQLGDDGAAFRRGKWQFDSCQEFVTVKYSQAKYTFPRLQQLEAVTLLPSSDENIYQQVPHILHPCTIRKWGKTSQVGALS